MAEKAQALIDAKIDAGELVKRENVRKLADFAPVALIEQLATLTHALSAEDVQALADVLAQARKAQKAAEKLAAEKLAAEKLAAEKLAAEKLAA